MLRHLTLAALWLAATAMAGGVTWAAVSWSGTEPVAGVDLQQPLTQAAVRRTLAELRAPQPAAPDTTLRSAKSRRGDVHRSRRPRPVLQTRSWQTAGGSVAIGCRGDHIQLLYAAPANGWAYHLAKATGGALTVRFARSSHEMSTLGARCSGGAPVEVSAATSRPVAPGSEPDD